MCVLHATRSTGTLYRGLSAWEDISAGLVPRAPGAGNSTISHVVPKKSRVDGPQKMGFAFHALLGFHRLYSRLLLKAAGARLLRRL